MGFKQAMLVAVLGNEDYWNKSNGFKEWKKLPDGYYKQDKVFDKIEEKEKDNGQSSSLIPFFRFINSKIFIVIN